MKQLGSEQGRGTACDDLKMIKLFCSTVIVPDDGQDRKHNLKVNVQYMQGACWKNVNGAAGTDQVVDKSRLGRIHGTLEAGGMKGVEYVMAVS